MEWQPIATAPKDGRHILAAWPETWAQGQPHAEVCHWSGTYWSYSYDGDAPPTHKQPTLWMPLPEPPK